MQSGADYQLKWPRQLFRSEAYALVNNTGPQDWSERCELLLEDAFVGVAPRDDFTAIQNSLDKQKFLASLLRRTDLLKEAPTDRVPYWSERQRSRKPGAVSLLATAREFIRAVDELEADGYFEMAFEKDCVDAPANVEPSDIFSRELDVSDVWPLNAKRLSKDVDLFCDVIEVLHDLVARPRARYFHSYSGCGWHHESFSVEAGQVLYRWRVNRLLGKSDIGLQLAAEGEDVGRLAAVTDDARTALAASMTARTDPSTGDLVRHAIALFRARNATEHDKRSAVIALAGVLEERRGLLKTELVSNDEGALFQIANGFAVRHRKDNQRTDYDPVFLDWLFWWYLATIELTDRILARQAATS